MLYNFCVNEPRLLKCHFIKIYTKRKITTLPKHCSCPSLNLDATVCSHKIKACIVAYLSLYGVHVGFHACRYNVWVHMHMHVCAWGDPGGPRLMSSVFLNLCLLYILRQCLSLSLAPLIQLAGHSQAISGL